ncbi:MAG: carboxypeptidase [Gemmatimonadetes bacterium]|nr:carboxypeptidase [Gemmatimonadota bacterium]NNM33910.1 carboxypeptidase [Gemmatimonadota bacterium]
MTRIPSFLVALTLAVPGLAAQEPPTSPENVGVERSLPAEFSLVSNDQVTVKGVTVPYQVTTGTLPVYGDDGGIDAALYYTYYERTDVDDRSRRPLFISFNGGPGSGSLWMHLGYTSPKQLIIDDEGYPIQPYGVRDNPHSIIDVADIVFVNPVNTGFSRILDPDADRERFFGAEPDVAYLAAWIDLFVSRQGRWSSPKYLIGESYGTMRVAGLAGQLQNRHWMYLNGVILVSPTGLGLRPEGPAPRANVLKLPYYTAAAHYHGKLAPNLQSSDLEDLLPEVEQFAIDEFLPALARGGSIEDGERQRIARQVAAYSGLSVQTVLNHNLAVPSSYFWKDLLREEGYTIGRLDSRYLGVDRMSAGDRYDYPAELTSWNHAFAPAINQYLREELGFETDLQYYLFGPVNPWSGGNPNYNGGEQLRQAMAQNPFLQVMVQSGFYDGATDYFTAKYVMWHIDPSGRLQDRMRFEGYRSGHMMYLRAEDLASSNEHIREFIEESLTNGSAASYGRVGPPGS